jgi:dihydrofolate reductase
MKVSPPFSEAFAGGDVVLVAAVSCDGFISRDRGVPWDLPKDREHFRAITNDRWLLVGRRTYDEMTGWFGNRTPLILTGSPARDWPTGEPVASVEEARALAQGVAEPLMVIGGGSVYHASLPSATHLVLTRVDDTLGKGVSFPKWDPNEWSLDQATQHTPDAEHAVPFAIQLWSRRNQS